VRSLPGSLLLYGPPGCGKVRNVFAFPQLCETATTLICTFLHCLCFTQTQLARAIAGEARAAFLSVGPSDILSKFVGESEASVRSIFKKGKKEISSSLECTQT
jgi:ATP-dependent 26S proteasome regulatory subunit